MFEVLNGLAFLAQGAARLPEFILKITHPDTEHATKIYFHLHTM
jgi:translation initiation factor 2-alpha kinase 4